LVLTHHLTMTGPGSIANEADLCFNNFTVSKRQAQSRSAKTQQSSRTHCEIVFRQWFSRNGLSAIDCIIARILIFVNRTPDSFSGANAELRPCDGRKPHPSS
jgi:hypothetical protein